MWRASEESRWCSWSLKGHGRRISPRTKSRWIVSRQAGVVVRPLKQPHRSWQALLPVYEMQYASCFCRCGNVWRIKISKPLPCSCMQGELSSGRPHHLGTHYITLRILHRQTRDMPDNCRPQLCNGVEKTRSIAVCGVMLFYRRSTTAWPQSGLMKRDCRCCAWQILVNTKPPKTMEGS